MSDKKYTELKHFGILGMKWGRRKNRTKYRDSNFKYKHKNLRYVDDKTLQKDINRLRMEREYKNLAKPQKRYGAAAIAIGAVSAGLMEGGRNYVSRKVQNTLNGNDKKISNAVKNGKKYVTNRIFGRS